MDLSGAFGAMVAGPDAEIRLDEAMLLIAAQARPELDRPAVLRALDQLADACPGPTLDHLVRHLFVDLGFSGNRDDYYDARNSYLDCVLERRLGIPISLSVLTIVVGRRVGVSLAGVAMPGHFLLRDKVDPTVFLDPFDGGTRLDVAGCARLFARLQGPAAPFDERYLEPVGHRAILSRVLANLKAIHETHGDRQALVGVLRLRAAIPGVGDQERRELAAALAAAGQFGAAADELEAVAGAGTGEQAEADLTAATRHRARLN